MFWFVGVHFHKCGSSVCQLCMWSYSQNNISHDVPLYQQGQTAGVQEEFQIFDKHVKAGKPGLAIMPILLLPSSMWGINFQTKMF